MFTSDLARAVETAEIAFAGTGVPIRQDPRLRECNYGTLNGMPVSQLARIRSRHIQQPFPAGTVVDAPASKTSLCVTGRASPPATVEAPAGPSVP